MRKLILAFILIMGIATIGYAQTITIGSQVWSTKNLDVSTFKNGDPIPQAKTDEEWVKASENKQPAWCYYNNDPENGKKYGKLYNWYAVNDSRGLAPSGYHIPNEAEWNTLAGYLGGEKIAGKKMKSTNGWIENGNGTNKSGFSGLPGGIRRDNGTFMSIGKTSYWWCSGYGHSSDENTSDYAGLRGLHYEDGDVFRSDLSKDWGLSVRCLRN